MPFLFTKIKLIEETQEIKYFKILTIENNYRKMKKFDVRKNNKQMCKKSGQHLKIH